MKYVFLFFLIFDLSCPRGLAERFVIPDVGVSLTTPDGEVWRAFKDEVPGTNLQPVGSKTKLRVHLSVKAASPEEAIATVTRRLMENGTPGLTYELLSLKPVETVSGLKGVVGAYGVKGRESDTVTIKRYFFLRPDGRSFCVCAYLGAPEAQMDDFRYEKIILNTLVFLSKENPVVGPNGERGAFAPMDEKLRESAGEELPRRSE